MVKIEGNLEVFKVKTVQNFTNNFRSKRIKRINRKEQVCSYGLSKKVRVWTYSRHWKGIVEQQFIEKPRAVAIHPTGYLIALGSKTV